MKVSSNVAFTADVQIALRLAIMQTFRVHSVFWRK